MHKTTVIFAILLIFVFGCVSTPLQPYNATATYPQSSQSTPEQPPLAGKPMECKVTVTNAIEVTNVTSTTITMYANNGKLRQEMNGEASIVMIMKNNAIYTNAGYDQGILTGKFKDCDWIKYDIALGNVTPNPAVSIQEIMDNNAMKNNDMVKMTCKAGSFGDEKFETPGKVCFLSEIMKDLASSFKNLSDMNLSVDAEDYGNTSIVDDNENASQNEALPQLPEIS